MLPATSPSETIAIVRADSFASVFAQCAMNASRSRDGNAAIAAASGSHSYSYKAGRSPSTTSRNTPMQRAYRRVQIVQRESAFQPRLVPVGRVVLPPGRAARDRPGVDAEVVPGDLHLLMNEAVHGATGAERDRR